MFTERIQPRFSEMNPAGHIGFTVLPVWFEKAAEEVCRLFMPDMNPVTWSIIVVKFEMECLAEIHFREEVIISTRVERMGTSSFSLEQFMEQGSQIAARAETTMVHFDYSTGKSRPLTDEHRKMLSLHQAMS